MSCKWIVPGPNAKVLAQAIHCLAKIGEELYVEGGKEKLVFRTVNMPKTAFISISLHPDFFSFYPINLEDGPRCQISMKAALIVFRVPASMDRTVENCAVVCSDDLLEFRIKYKAGFVKTNRLQLVDAEVLQSSYEDSRLPSKVVIEPRVLSSLLASFHSLEITWAISADGMQLRNFSELEDDTGGLHSEVYVGKDELLELVVENNESIQFTFCLGELRTVLTFAEQIACPLECSFSAPGSPIFFMVSNQVITCQVVLSTLSASETQVSQQPNPQPESEPVNRSDPQLQGTQELLQVLHHVLKRQPSNVSELPGYSDILAPDSDEESEA